MNSHLRRKYINHNFFFKYMAKETEESKVFLNLQKKKHYGLWYGLEPQEVFEVNKKEARSL